MKYEKLKTAAETITMPDAMKQRIIRNCKAETEKNMRSNTIVRKPAAVLAAFVVCLALSVTAVAAPDTVKGFFKDIRRWDGAVTGTTYEQATDEIDLCVTVEGNSLAAIVTFADPQMMPYVYAERLGIAEYSIVNANGKVIKKGAVKSAEIFHGRATVSIPLGDLDGGDYKLIVSAFVAEKKADQPLMIHGSWECAFTK